MNDSDDLTPEDEKKLRDDRTASEEKLLGRRRSFVSSQIILPLVQQMIDAGILPKPPEGASISFIDELREE